MKYGYTTLATNWNAQEMGSWKVRFIKAILFFIPRSNPDQEALYPKVTKWLLEIDDSGIPNREIGIDEDGRPLFVAPNLRNSGFWVDSNNRFEVTELEPEEANHFEQLWSKFETK